MATDVVLVWKVWRLKKKSREPTSTIWLIPFLSDISDIQPQSLRVLLVLGLSSGVFPLRFRCVWWFGYVLVTFLCDP